MKLRTFLMCFLTSFMVLISVCCIGQVNPYFKHEIDLEKAYLLINLGKYKLPPNKRAEAVNLEKFGNISSPYVRPGLMESKNYIFLEINKWERKSQVNEFGLASNKVGSLGLILYEKSSSNSMIISSERIDNDIPCFYPFFSDGQNRLISYVDAHEAVEFYQKNKTNPKLNRKFIEVAKNMKVDDNPIVMVAYLK